MTTENQTQTETEDVKTEEAQTEKTEDTRTDEQKLHDQYDYDDSVGDDDLSTDEKDKGDDKDSADDQKAADDTAGSKKEQEDTETEKKSVINDELLGRAEKMGFTRYEAQSFSNAEDLQRTLDILDGADAKTGGEEKKTGEEDSQKEPEFKIDLSPDEYDGKVIKTFEDLNKFHTDRYSALETKLNQVLEAVGNDQAAAADVRFESMIEGLGEDFTETLGKGPGHSLDQKSTQFENRVKLHEEIVRIAAGYAALGQQVPTEKELFEKAVGVVFKDKQKNLEMDKLGKKLDKRSKQSLGRAAPHKDKELSPDQRAVKYVNDFYKKNNIDLGEGSDETYF